ncbi:MAG: hypothetical protein J6S43_00895, partial [Lentisphaeria bacterium]|nr:hypothetical protein [Lentisphaeria bacterium]
SATQEVFVDTCWREQALWTRDAAVSGPASFYLFGDLAVWKESLRLIGENISADGIPAAVVPAGVSHLVLVDQTFCWINSLEQYFMISGDENFIREMHLPVMNFLRLMRQFTTEQGLFAPPLWSWHFIDWAEVDLRPWSLAINAMLYSALISAERLSGSSENDGKFLSEFRELSQCGLSYFWDEEKGYYRNHLDGAAPELIETVFFRSENNCPNALPVHGNALLLAHGLFPEKYRCAAAGKLAKWLLPADQSIAKFGTSWFTIITKALFENGQSSAAWELLYERYGSAIKENSRTFGEKFPFGQFNSAHGWSTGIAEILFSTVWGIKIIAPGFRKISIAPVKALPDGEVKLHTPGGVVHLAAENGSVTVLDCTMPFLRLDP